MPYDLFVSYSRHDNAQGRVTELVNSIAADFDAFGASLGRSLEVFFDIHPEDGIKGMEDWRHAILRGLRESRLLLACLSPAYLESPYCEWEFHEYLKHEVGRATFGEGVAPVYFVEVPGWTGKGFEAQCAAWVAELRRRQHIDLRPWFHAGEAALRDAVVQDRMRQLNAQLKARIVRSERAERNLGNVATHNLRFVGRTAELRRLREAVGLGQVGILTVLHGLGGMGKSALAIEYAHAFGHEYGGGRWQLPCEGKDDIRALMVELAGPLGLRFDEDERRTLDRQFELVIAELRRLAHIGDPHRCFLLLDNVDQRSLLEPAQWQRLPAEDWLHIVATTRFGEDELFGRHRDRNFVSVDELSENDGAELIGSFQPSGSFESEEERRAALAVVRALGCFTLAVETAAVYLGQFSDEISCSDFSRRLLNEGCSTIDAVAEQTTEGLRHGERRVAPTLTPTLARLAAAELYALRVAAELPADHIVLQWIRDAVSQRWPEFERDAPPGYPDPWLTLLRRLLGLRLLLASEIANGRVVVAKMHRIVQGVVQSGSDVRKVVIGWLRPFLLHRSEQVGAGTRTVGWELVAMREVAHSWIAGGEKSAQQLAAGVCRLLYAEADFGEAIRLGRRAASHLPDVGPHAVCCLNVLGSALLQVGEFDESEEALLRAREVCSGDHEVARDWLSTTASNLGALFGETGRVEEAAECMNSALALDIARFGPHDRVVSIRLLNYAKILRDMNRIADAIGAASLALEIDVAALGSDSPVVAGDLSALGNLLQDSGESERARQMLEQAVSIARHLPAADRKQLAVDLRNLARVVEHLGDLDAAEHLLRESLTIDREVAGGRNPAVAVDMNNLAVNLRHQGRLEEAMEFHQQALSIDRERRGNQHPKVALRLLNWAVTLMMNRDSATAAMLLADAWAIARVRNNRLGVRILLVRFCLALQLGEQPSVLLGQLKTMLMHTTLTSVGVDPSWDHEPTRKWLENNAGAPESQIVLRALFDAERVARVTPVLEGTQLWRASPPVDLGCPW